MNVSQKLVTVVYCIKYLLYKNNYLLVKPNDFVAFNVSIVEKTGQVATEKQ